MLFAATQSGEIGTALHIAHIQQVHFTQCALSRRKMAADATLSLVLSGPTITPIGINTRIDGEIMPATIYHNPRCSKSRQTLQLLNDNGIEPEIVEYLKNPPSEEALSAILQLLELEPRDLMRKNEAPYKELNLANEVLTRDELIAAMVQHPILIERPIVVSGDKAVIGRPPENVLEVI